MKFSGKMWLTIIPKVTKKTGFYTLEDAKSTGGGGQIDPPPPSCFRLSSLFQTSKAKYHHSCHRGYTWKQYTLPEESQPEKLVNQNIQVVEVFLMVVTYCFEIISKPRVIDLN